MNEKQYAVNIADLTHFAQKKTMHPVTLLLDPVLSHVVVHAEGRRLDGDAVILDCEPERAKAIISVIRMKIPKHMLRIYTGAGQTWRRI